MYDRINQRVDLMMEAGLLEEVKNLVLYKNLNALQTVGYKELFDYFAGRSSLEEAVESIKINTRHYAKRQITWFKKDKEVKWCPPDFDLVIQQIKNLYFIVLPNHQIPYEIPVSWQRIVRQV